MQTLLFIVAAFAVIYLFAGSGAAAAILGGGSDTLQSLGGLVDVTQVSAALKIARAIGVAEGGYDSNGNNRNNGSRPSRNKNPLDMTADLIGKAIGFDGMFPQYATDADGWENGLAQVNAWLNGTSQYHNADSSIADVAGLGSEKAYTTTDQTAWANTVAQQLNVSTDTPIGQIA